MMMVVGGSVTLSWSAPSEDGSSGVVGYDVRHRVGDGDWTEVQRVDPAGLTETVSGLSNGVEYRVEVRAVNRETTSLWSGVDVTPVGPGGRAEESGC